MTKTVNDRHNTDNAPFKCKVYVSYVSNEKEITKGCWSMKQLFTRILGGERMRKLAFPYAAIRRLNLCLFLHNVLMTEKRFPTLSARRTIINLLPQRSASDVEAIRMFRL